MSSTIYNLISCHMNKEEIKQIYFWTHYEKEEDVQIFVH